LHTLPFLYFCKPWQYGIRILPTQPLLLFQYLHWHLVITPNPATDFITLDKFDTQSSIEIFDMNGKNVISTLPTYKLERIDVSFLKTGLYYILHKNKEKTMSSKFVKI